MLYHQPREEYRAQDKLDLKGMSWEEVIASWNACLLHAQAASEPDRGIYSPGVFPSDSSIYEIVADLNT